MRRETFPAKGTVVGAEALARTIPDTLGDFTAIGAARPREVKLSNGGSVNSAIRDFKSGRATAKLELTDVQHAPPLQAIALQAQSSAEKGESDTFDFTRIKGQAAVKTWNEAKGEALVNLFFDKRFLVNVRVSDTGDSQVGEKMLAGFPFHKLTELRQEAEAADQPKATSGDAAVDAAAAKADAAQPPKPAATTGETDSPHPASAKPPKPSTE